jgi:hypothetical protein
VPPLAAAAVDPAVAAADPDAGDDEADEQAERIRATAAAAASAPALRWVISDGTFGALLTWGTLVRKPYYNSLKSSNHGDVTVTLR